MKVLAVGGAGTVGTLLRPALEAQHDLYVFDARKVDGLDGRSLVGDVSDDAAVRRAVAGMDAVIYMPMGVRPDVKVPCQDIDAAFNVNVRGAYRFLNASLEAGTRRFVYASSMSVYDHRLRRPILNEDMPADEWGTYGLSKRLAEEVCAAAATRWPDAVILALRLVHPIDELALRRHMARRPEPPFQFTAPNDLRRLFLAALSYDRPGLHIVQASSDTSDARYPNARVTELLGWRPTVR